jgi:beta-hydroxylase
MFIPKRSGDREMAHAMARGALPKRSSLYRAVKRMRGSIDRLIARDSLISNAPVLDPGLFPWTEQLQAEWKAIRAEAQAVMTAPGSVPPLRSVSPDHRRISRDDRWRSFFLYGYGYRIDSNCARCPRTTALVESIPDLNSAFFSILGPGAHIAAHRGPTKALVTSHLGLMVPDGRSCRMILDGRPVEWREGEWLVFDDTYRHEVWQDADQPRVILLIQVRRPLEGLGKLLASLFVGAMRISPFVQEGRRNITAWERANGIF